MSSTGEPHTLRPCPAREPADCRPSCRAPCRCPFPLSPRPPPTPRRVGIQLLQKLLYGKPLDDEPSSASVQSASPGPGAAATGPGEGLHGEGAAPTDLGPGKPVEAGKGAAPPA